MSRENTLSGVHGRGVRNFIAFPSLRRKAHKIFVVGESLILDMREEYSLIPQAIRSIRIES